MRGIIVQVSVSRGGIPKLGVPSSLAGPLGLEGDDHRNKQVHGGPRQALLLVSEEDLEGLRAEGFEVGPGALGENLTVQGMDFRGLRPGMRFQAGDAVIELTKERRPCSTLDVYNAGEAGAIQRALEALPARGGFYAAVVQPGVIRAGDIICLADAKV